MEAPHYVFAGGGTGGHLFPGLAVANAVLKNAPRARITFLTTTRDLDRQLLEKAPFTQVAQPVRPFSSRPWHWPGFWLAWRASVRRAGEFIRSQNVRAVLGLGGYAAGPAVVAAHKLGVRTAILNPDAIPGRANQHLAKYADLVVLQWDVSRRFFPSNTNCQTLGCPIRADFQTILEFGIWNLEVEPAATHPQSKTQNPKSKIASAAREQFGLAPDRPTLLVTGASQGARTINQALWRVWPLFAAAHPEWQLLHLTGPADEETTRAAYAAAFSQNTGLQAATHVLAFTHAMAAALCAADVVISRAGASTLAELTALGQPSILLPYPYHKDRHQHANAQVLVDAGAAILLEDRLQPDLNRGPLLTALETLADAAARRDMAQAAQTLGRPDAAERVAGWLIN